jgi:hypothetical protein
MSKPRLLDESHALELRISALALSLILLLGIPATIRGEIAGALFSRPDTTTAADSIVTFNEIMYHPAGDDPSQEWVELYNQMAVDIEISNWRIEGGIEFSFPTNTVLPANGYVVVAADPAALQAATGATNVFGPFAKRLANNGETLRLRNHNNRLLDELTFGDDWPWPLAADGSGASLAKIDKYSASSPGANWRASAQIGGTPSRPNFPDLESSGPIVEQWLTPGSAGRWWVPRDGSLGQAWTLPGFDDSAWASGLAAVGFDATTNVSHALPAARAYSFDGGLTDDSGHGFDALNLGAQFSTNVAPAVGSGQSLQFDGVADQVQVPDPVNPAGYTLSLWVAVDAVRPCSLLVRTDSNGPDVTWSHQLRINGSGQFEHYLWDGSVRSVAATNVIVPGVWYHLAATATNGGPMRIYVNGVSSGGSVAFGNLWGGGNQWRLGTDSGHTPNFFRGRLDEVGIWQDVLDPADLVFLAAGTPPWMLNGYRSRIGTDVQAAMFQTGSSLYLCLPFNVPAGVGYERLTLDVQFDDGFVAYLNGVEVARRNAPALLAWNSASITNRPAAAAFRAETIDLSAFASSLPSGRNVLAFQALNSAASDPEFFLTAALSALPMAPFPGQENLAFNEVAAADSPSFFIELLNRGQTSLTLSGCSVISSAGGKCVLGAGTLRAGAFLTLTTNDLGFGLRSGDKLFLVGTSGNVIDGVKVKNRLLGRLPSSPTGSWLYPSTPTLCATNQFSLHDEVVINEILYHHAPSHATNAAPPVVLNSDEQWVELYNRSAVPVDLGGWRLDDAITFSFPSNTVLAPDAYLVVANNAVALRAQYPDIKVLGDFSGQLSHRGAYLALIDAQGNPANEVTYYPDAPWPAYADGGGSSVELRDPRADNSVPESWAASIETTKAAWRHYSYRARAINPVYSPNIYSFNEFRLGLQAEGEALLDNITVVELPTNAPPRQLLQNTNFLNGTAKWRLTGNHKHSRVEPNPDAPSNPVLHLIATGPMSYLENQLETTLKVGGVLVPVVAGRDYEISFDAKWVAGSPQLHTELYYNKVAATTLLDRPSQCGTPGRRNSTYLANAGPTYGLLQHSPVVPAPTDNVSIIVRAADPDGVAGLTLHYAVNDGSWRAAAMAVSDSTPATYTAIIPAQPSGSVIQFFVEGADLLGATSTYPADGTNSRALIKVEGPQLVAGKRTFRTIMTPSDAALLHATVNLMSDDLLGCTAIHNEREIFYGARIRLHGSMFSRTDASSTGLTVVFPADHLFRGSHASVVVRRSDLGANLVKHILNQAGGLPANYNDVVYLVSHRADNVGTATLNLANYDRTYIDSQFENNNDGTAFKFEGIRVYTTTDDGTPEGLKLPQPIDFVWDYDLTNLGNDPEQYRWSILILNQRARDDYSRVVAMGQAFSRIGAALQPAAAAAIDVDEWARYFALQNLLGVTDIYGVDNPHNIAFYARPDDGRVVVLQNDWGFAYLASATASIYGKNNVYRILQLPGYRRLYQGHLLDLLGSVYNSTYLTRWARHFSDVTGMDQTGVPGYANARGAAVRSQLAAQIPFVITSNGGSNILVNTPAVALAGRGWINVHGIGLAGATNLLPVTWLDDVRWQATVPLAAGDNLLQLVAYDYRGTPVGQAAIVVTSTVSGFVQRDYLRLTELMYHPPPPTAMERASGFSSAEDFEFIELLNTGPTNISLIGVRFIAGVTFDFSTAAITNLAPAQRVLVVANETAFACRYGTNLPVAGAYAGHLDNKGEQVRLVDAWNNVILDFTYYPAAGWPTAADGGGSSLEVLDVNGDYNDPRNWQASLLAGGTPGFPAIIPPSFTLVSQEGTQLHLRFQAAAGQTYTLYWSEGLVPGQWQVLETVPAGASARFEEVTDDLAPTTPQRFYRLVTP